MIDFQFHPTPINIIDYMLSLTHLDKDTRALEPHAGSGNIVKKLNEHGVFVVVNELDKRHLPELRSICTTV